MTEVNPDTRMLVSTTMRTAFLAERLQLTLTDPLARPQPIRNGVDFLWHIVRPDFVLVRQRVVSRLKARLRDYEQQLVRPRPGPRIGRISRWPAAIGCGKGS